MRNYERFAPLAVEPGGLRGGYRRVQPGDAVVAFSRATIFTIKKVRFASSHRLARSCAAAAMHPDPCPSHPRPNSCSRVAWVRVPPMAVQLLGSVLHVVGPTHGAPHGVECSRCCIFGCS